MSNQTWRERIAALYPPPANIGEGLSRPMPTAKVREYKIKVHFAGTSPMTLVLKAESPAKALKYGKNRWPDSPLVEIVK